MIDAPLTLLPTPTTEDVAGFIDLYRVKYGEELDPVDAARKLGGLVRWLYLTGTTAPDREEVKNLPHVTQLTARKAGRSRKKA